MIIKGLLICLLLEGNSYGHDLPNKKNIHIDKCKLFVT